MPRRVTLSPEDLRFELRFAVRHLGHRTHAELARHDLTMLVILDAIADRLGKLEIVRILPDDVAPDSYVRLRETPQK